MTGPQTQRQLLKEKRDALRKKRTLLWVFAVVAGLLILALVYFLPSLTADRSMLYLQDGFSIGDPNAPVKVEEFSDFRCHYCRQFSEQMEPDFIKNYVDTGKVYFTFHNYPFLAADSTDAAEAAYCAADQNRFWQYKDVLFKYNTMSGAFASSSLSRYAQQVGMDTTAFDACMQGNTKLPLIEQSKAYTESLGIDSTPQFSVNGTIVYMNTLLETMDAVLAGN